MRRESEEPKTLCRKCGRMVLTPNFLIHESRCNGDLNISLQSRSESRLSSRSRPRKEKTEIMEPEEIPMEEQLIPCPFCGFDQTFEQLDTHPNQCLHRQQECPDCHSYFPRSLMQQHDLVCSGRRHRFISEESEQYEPLPQMREDFRERVRPFELLAPLFIRRHPRNIDNSLFDNPIRGGGIFMRPGNLQQADERLHRFATLIGLLAGRQQLEEGLSPTEINSLNKIKYKSKKNQEPDLCTVCYCNFEENQQIISLPCSHLFHGECISKWLQSNPLCPICKRSCKRS